MSDLIDAEREVSRRKFLAMGGTLAAAGTLGPLIDPLSALGSTTRWPKRHLSAGDAVRVRKSQFMPTSQFVQWHESLEKVGPANQKGLRATGTSAHEGYVDELLNDLHRAGLKQLHVESLSMERWTTDSWGLDVLQSSGAVPVRTSAYLPYSGHTPAAGISGPLAFVRFSDVLPPGALAGKIAVIPVPNSNLPITLITSLTYKGEAYDPHNELTAAHKYKRPFLSGAGPAYEKVVAAGAIGAVLVLDFPYEGAKGQYAPYDGVIRHVPGVYVDRTAGAQLQAQAQAGLRARLKLPSTIKRVKTRNLIGFIPGRSSELVCLHCHTDGSNAIEDNGPGAIVAMTQYLTRLPRHALPRTIMVLLTTGHFAGGNGSRDFRHRHANDLVKRTNAAITIEHLGTREWIETSPGKMGFTGAWEPGAMFAPGSKALVDASLTAIKRGKAAPAGVLKPLNPTGNGVTVPAWPGEGQYLFARGGIADSNYITGPTYLLNWGVKTLDKVSHDRIRAQAIGFTEMILRLGRTPRRDLTTYTL